MMVVNQLLKIAVAAIIPAGSSNVASPIPLAAPVTKARFPCRSAFMMKWLGKRLTELDRVVPETLIRVACLRDKVAFLYE